MSLTDKVNKEVTLPKVELDLKEMVDIVAQGYKIETVPFYGNIDNTTELLGLHIDDGNTLEILINKFQTMEEKRLTIIHECYHALERKYGYTQDETVVQELALRTYRRLYGEPEFSTKMEIE